MKKINYILISVFIVISLFGSAQNPIADYYKDNHDYPAWISEIKWNNKIDMSHYSNGLTNIEKFENARDSLYNLGGGILYYPAGNYYFDLSDTPQGKGIMLKKGVVILGETPTEDLNAVSDFNINYIQRHGLNTLKTNFIFSTKKINNNSVPKMWNCIGITTSSKEQHLGQVSHVGIAWVNIEYGYIFFGFGASNWASNWSSSISQYGSKSINDWQNRKPDGSHIMDAFAGTANLGNDTAFLGEKRFVFGCNLKNSTVPNYVINKANLIDFIIEPGSFNYAGRITVYGKHLFISNNVISKPTACFIYNHTVAPGGQKTGIQQILYDYANSKGIEINKSLLSPFWNRCVIDNKNGSYYAEDIIVIDNWIYNHGNTGFALSGKWMIVKNNINYRDYLDFTNVYNLPSIPSCIINKSQFKCFTTESTTNFESNAFNINGWNSWIHNNKYTGTGSCVSKLDGNGIFSTRTDGSELFSTSITNNENGIDGDKGLIGTFECHVLGLFIGSNKTNGQIGIIYNNINNARDISLLNNTNTYNSIVNPEGKNEINTQDFLDTCPLKSAGLPINITVEKDIQHKFTKIKYTDTTTEEIGYKIIRKENGKDSWITIAIRPRKSTGSNISLNYTASDALGQTPNIQCKNQIADFNVQEWIDYTADPMLNYSYDVIPLSCIKEIGQECPTDDIIAPIITFIPGNNECIPTDNTIKIAFNEALKNIKNKAYYTNTTVDSLISIKNITTNTLLNFDATINNRADTISINCTEFKNNNEYLVILKPVKDSCGNTSKTQSILLQGIKNSKLIITGDSVLCEGDSLTLTTSLDYANYKWSNGSTFSFTKVKSAGNYYVTATITNTCIWGYSDTISIREQKLPEINLTQNNQTICANTSITVAAIVSNYQINNNYKYKWSNNSSDSISLLKAGNYTLTVTDKFKCSTLKNIKIDSFPAITNAEICLVTVDTKTNKNKLVWERENNKKIKFYSIYKETAIANNYSKIGVLPIDSAGVFIDNASNSKTKAERYKISILDSCGIESNLSDFHQTIHLSISKGLPGYYNLSWNQYVGFNYLTYYIYKGYDSINFFLLDSIATTKPLNYTDTVKNIAWYMIGIKKEIGCNPYLLKNTGEPYSQSVSNLIDNSKIKGTGINEIKNESDLIEAYPNPFTNELHIRVKAKKQETVKIELINALGESIYCNDNACNSNNDYVECTLNTNTPEVNSSFYLIRILLNDVYYYKKVMKTNAK